MINQFRSLGKNFFNQKSTHLFSFEPIAIVLIISFGVLVRVIQYASNRSLWADEATLALNIVNRSLWQLFQPLDYDQGAPVGFLVIEKLAIQTFGNSEYALRLFPLLCGIAALFLFYALAKRWLQGQALLISLVLFATLRPLIYYSSEVKQYSSDVAITLVLCLAVMQIRNLRLTWNQILLSGAIGAIAVWFSHPAIFVLAGLEASYLLPCLLKREIPRILDRLWVYLAWLLSFVGVYVVSLKDLGSDKDLLKSWSQAFPSSPFDLIWGLDALGKYFSNPLGFPELIDGLAIVLFLAGCISAYLRRREILLFSLSPIAMTLAAAYLQRYPFRNRLVIFLIPFFILLIAEGTALVRRKVRTTPFALLSLVLPILLIASPIVRATTLVVAPEQKEEIRSVLSYIKDRQQPGDVIYVYQRGIYQFKYYAEKYGYREGSYILGVEDLDTDDNVKILSEPEQQRYAADLNQLRGKKRVWLLFSHANIASENKFFETYLERIGRRIDRFQAPGAFVYLYDLS